MSELRGYDYNTVTVKKVMKDHFVLSPEIESQIAREEITQKMLSVLNNKGRVYFISRKKVVYGIVIIGFENHMASEFEFEVDADKKADTVDKIMDEVVESEGKLQKTFKHNEKEEKKQSANAYVLQDIYLSEDLKEKDKIIMNDLIEELKEAAAFDDVCVKVIIWGDKIVADKTIGKIGVSSVSIGMSLGMCVGMMLGQVLFDNLALGMCIGLCVGSSIGAAYYAGANKKVSSSLERTEDKENEGE